MKNQPKVLIYGYGNPGRQDDGLGIIFTEHIEEWIKNNKINNVSVDSNYQLNIEDADTISKFDIVIFVDATQENIEEFTISKVNPSPETEFTMHSVAPSLVLYLCNDIYKKIPDTYLLHIKGYEWNFMTKITDKALNNFQKAFEFITTKFLNEEYEF